MQPGRLALCSCELFALFPSPCSFFECRRFPVVWVSVWDPLGNRALEYDPVFDPIFNEYVNDDPPGVSFSAYLPNRLNPFLADFNMSPSVRGDFEDNQFPRGPFDASPSDVAGVDVSIQSGMEFSMHYGFDSGLVSRVDFAWSEGESVSLVLERCDGSVSETLEPGPDMEVWRFDQRTFHYGCPFDPAPASACLSPCEP